MLGDDSHLVKRPPGCVSDFQPLPSIGVDGRGGGDRRQEAQGVTLKSDKLVKRIDDALRDRSQAGLAGDVGVSTKTLSEVRKGWKKRDLTPRKRVGLAESLTRLSLYFQLRPEKVMTEVGIWDKPGVQAKSRATVEAEVVSTSGRDVAAKGDRALTDIQVRGRLDNQPDGIVKLGILAWEPFHWRGSRNSFAELYCRSLIQAVNPEWLVEVKEYYNLADPLKALTGRPEAGGGAARAPEVDLVFGLYDLVPREAQGLRFVPVPGLSVRAGAVWIGEELSWFEILSPASDDERPFAIVVRAEAGHLTLAGACGYTEASLRILNSVEPDKVVEAMLEEQKTRRRVCFVADSFTATAVRNRLDEEMPPRVKIGLVGDKSNEWAPQYQVGLGVRADSSRFRALLLRATQMDLFGTSVPHAAHLYWRLLKRYRAEKENRVRLRRTSMKEQLGEGRLDGFKRAVEALAPKGSEKKFKKWPFWNRLYPEEKLST